VLAIGLALAASVAYGVSDFLGGLKTRSLALLGVPLVSQGTGLVALAVIAIGRGEGPPAAGFLVFAVLAGLSETVGVAALYRGLASGLMSVVAPVAAAAPVVPIVAALALGELPTAIQGGGIGLAVAGIVLTVRGRPATAGPGATLRASVVLGLLAAVGFGSFYVALDAASEFDVTWALLGARITTIAVFLGAVAATRQRIEVPHRDLPVLALIGLLIVAADALFAVASTLGLLGVVAVLSALYPLVTIALATLYLDESLGRIQLARIACAFGGVVAVAVA
jgi:drug/metabolite transporter (DMT)-like permease